VLEGPLSGALATVWLVWRVVTTWRSARTIWVDRSLIALGAFAAVGFLTFGALWMVLGRADVDVPPFSPVWLT